MLLAELELIQNFLLGAATWSRGLDWMHGEGASHIRGCSVWEPLADDCLWIRKIPPETENSLSIQWQLPTLFNHEYPVLQHLRLTPPPSSFEFRKAVFSFDYFESEQLNTWKLVEHLMKLNVSSDTFNNYANF